jgi:hypothetical protein
MIYYFLRSSVIIVFVVIFEFFFVFRIRDISIW